MAPRDRCQVADNTPRRYKIPWHNKKFVICRGVDGARGHYGKGNEPGTERHSPHDSTLMENLVFIVSEVGNPSENRLLLHILMDFHCRLRRCKVWPVNRKRPSQSSLLLHTEHRYRTQYVMLKEAMTRTLNASQRPQFQECGWKSTVHIT